MALERYDSAIGIARAVMEKSRHSVLAGPGAQQFAVLHGFVPAENDELLLTPHAARRHTEHCSSGTTPLIEENVSGEMPHTDTVGIICRDTEGRIAVGCATSGMQFKDVGRVGDSPLIGCGLYGSDAGAAVASGDGDQMIRFCLAFLVVELMRAGQSPSIACHNAMVRVRKYDPGCQAAIAAMSSSGETGAACTNGGFSVVTWRGARETPQEHQEPELVTVTGISEDRWQHTCV